MVFKISDIRIRDANEDDFPFILKLNRENVEVLAEMDEDKLSYFKERAELFFVVEADDVPAAFLIGLKDGVDDYDSENYRWFSKNYSRFLYVDRIVIDEAYRKMGIGKRLYMEVFRHAGKTGADIVAAEIDIIPYNESSLKFHEKMGFEEVGTQYVREGTVKVSLQVAEVGRKLSLSKNMQC